MKPRWIVAGSVAVAAVVGTGLGLVAQDQPSTRQQTLVSSKPSVLSSSPGSDLVPTDEVTAPQLVCGIQWYPGPDATSLPVSDCYGPTTRTELELASGFSHDELGAVIAGINIASRLSSNCGKWVYEGTANTQTLGDVTSAIADISREESSATAEETRPSRWWYRLSAGDPHGELVGVVLIASTPQSRARGDQYARLELTLRWLDGDWRLQLPRPRPRLTGDLDGATELGGQR
ncbi:hypothetical protein F0L68_17285 [Solihabitans fulvus]|uniref:DUF8175 domain-containing protein n=1 Tax=Solihabitans fulvus TaxID=1892852 RepID=A0A5B2XEP9_9PSEU|nr:hypothetical protein [Solihabitans fulvus]KAA2261525.1 hypothetical protein F0L68_17285 [Solihabitans fulvus]